MNKKFIAPLIFGLGTILTALFLFNQTAAQKILNVKYPVPELNNCANEAACRAYCDQPKNMAACLNFAEKNNLMSSEEIGRAKKFAEVGKGPGECRNKNECDLYCSESEHIEECIDFAIENDLVPPEELAEAKKAQAAIKRGVKPPPCRDKKACDVYCEEPEHMEECIAFGIEAGFIQGKELEDVQKMLIAVKRGVKPPPCRGKEACDVYCGLPENMEGCMSFAIEAGFMNEQEKADSQKMLQALKKGVKPPQCRGKEECDTYCAEEEHFEECTKFAEAAGFISPEDAVMVRKTKGKSPGNCKGKEECDAFCKNPDNQELCFNFALEHGFIPEEELEKMKEGMEGLREGLETAMPEVLECLKTNLGQEIIEKIRAGALIPGPQIGEQTKRCFEEFGGGPGESSMAGPGDCQSMEECAAYCSEPQNLEECQTWVKGKEFQPPKTGKPDICIQVITPAEDPETGECYEFGTPCAVPPGWRLIDREEAQEMDCKPMMPRQPDKGDYFPNDFSSQNQFAPNAENFPMEGPAGCQTAEECMTYCFQPENAEMEECAEFNSGPGEMPPAGMLAPESLSPNLLQIFLKLIKNIFSRQK